MADTGDAEMKDADPQSQHESEGQPQQNGTTENGTEASSNDDRKLFVGRLSWETTDKELREHFGQYGEIETVSVKTDPQSGRSRGFAFIVFKDIESIEKVMAAGDHVINNKKVDPKKAKARHGKIFVGGLDVETKEEDIRNFFGQFGTIIDIELPFDKQKGQRKNFCFITFESEQVTNNLLKEPKQTINGKEVDVKKANPKAGDGRGGPGGRGNRAGRGGPGRRGQGGWGNQGSGYGNNYGGGYGGYGGGYGYDGYYNGGGYGSGYGGGYDYSGYGQGYNQGYGSGGGGGGGGGYGGFGGGKQRGGRNQRPAPY